MGDLMGRDDEPRATGATHKLVALEANARRIVEAQAADRKPLRLVAVSERQAEAMRRFFPDVEIIMAQPWPRK